MLFSELLSNATRGRGSTVHLRRFLAPYQIRFVDDRAFVTTACGTRRSGKTTAVVGRACINAVPGEQTAIFALTAIKSWSLFRPKLDEFCRDVCAGALSYEYSGTERTCTLSTGGRFKFYGTTSQRDLEIARGDRYAEAYVQEAGTLGESKLSELLDSVLEPAMSDLWGKGGRGIVLDGTPSRLFGGLWHRLCEGKEKEASAHFMNILANPFYSGGRAEAYLADVLRRNRWTRSTPRFVREYLGQFVLDTEGGLVPSFNGLVLPDDTIPLEGRTVLGVDFGLVDPCAWVVLRETRNAVHVIHCEEASGLSIAEIAATTRRIQRQFRVGETWGDAYGVGAQLIHSLKANYGVSIKPCKYSAKSKAPRIELIESLCASGGWFVHEGARAWRDQAVLLQWNDEHTGPVEGFPDHLFDASVVGAECLFFNKQLPREPDAAELAERERQRQIAIQRQAAAAGPRW
jgi:hypothetical protein